MLLDFFLPKNAYEISYKNIAPATFQTYTHMSLLNMVIAYSVYGGICGGGIFWPWSCHFFLTLRAYLEDYFKCMT